MISCKAISVRSAATPSATVTPRVTATVATTDPRVTVATMSYPDIVAIACGPTIRRIATITAKVTVVLNTTRPISAHEWKNINRLQPSLNLPIRQHEPVCGPTLGVAGQRHAKVGPTNVPAERHDTLERRDK